MSGNPSVSIWATIPDATIRGTEPIVLGARITQDGETGRFRDGAAWNLRNLPVLGKGHWQDISTVRTTVPALDVRVLPSF